MSMSMSATEGGIGLRNAGMQHTTYISKALIIRHTCDAHTTYNTYNTLLRATNQTDGARAGLDAVGLLLWASGRGHADVDLLDGL